MTEFTLYNLETASKAAKPLFEKSNTIVEQLNKILKQQIPIIAVGGIFSGADACEKINRGASLVQVYTGLIYEGPALVADCLHSLQSHSE